MKQIDSIKESLVKSTMNHMTTETTLILSGSYESWAPKERLENHRL